MRLAILLFSFFIKNVLAGGPITILKPGDPIPENRFIFVIMHTDSREVRLGYSKKESDITNPHSKGVRNGGHVVLLMDALGIDEASSEQIWEKTDKKWIGGGFVKDSNGFTYLHPFMSNKGAGAVNHTFTQHNRAPIRGRSTLNNIHVDQGYLDHAKPKYLIPEVHADAFYQRISTLTGQPLRIDENFMNSERFKFNQAKHGLSSLDVSLHKTLTMYWMEPAVEGVNSFQRKEIRRLNTQCFKKALDALK
jgi:hypothetical protein